MLKRLTLILILASLTFAQPPPSWGREPVRLLGVGILGFIYLALACLLFSLIFWGVYLWLVKGKEKKD